MGFLFLKTIFSSIKSWITTVLQLIIKHPKQAIIIAGLTLAILGGIKIKNSFDELKEQNTALVIQVKTSKNESAQLRLDVAAAVKVNESNQEVIEKLSIAAVDSAKQVEDLKKVQIESTKKIEVIRTVIAESKPQDDGPVAKVLKDTIRSIQENREAAQ